MKIVEVITDAGHVDTILSIAEQFEVTDCWHYQLDQEQRHTIRMLVPDESMQSVLDTTQKTISSSENSRVIVMPVEATIPRQNSDKKEKPSSASREQLLDVLKQCALDLL